MDDYAVVVNAGSSSLKFSVFRQPASAAWHIECRGQVEGLGTAPRMDIAPTLAFAKRLAALGRRIWIRFVLVPGLTDDHDDIAGIARFAAGLGNVERVEVLPFHQMGRFKWKKLDKEYTLDAVEPPSRALVADALAIFRAEGLTAY